MDIYGIQTFDSKASAWHVLWQKSYSDSYLVQILSVLGEAFIQYDILHYT